MAPTANIAATTNLHVASVGRGAVARLRGDERAAHQLDAGQRRQDRASNGVTDEAIRDILCLTGGVSNEDDFSEMPEQVVKQQQ